MLRRTFLLSGLAPAFGMALAALPAAASEPKKKGGGVNYTQFRTITVFTETGKRRHGTMSVDMGLYAEDPKLVEQIKVYQPRLVDAYLTRLQAYAGTLNAQSLVDTAYVSVQLQLATDQVLGRKGARVLLGSVLLN